MLPVPTRPRGHIAERLSVRAERTNLGTQVTSEITVQLWLGTSGPLSVVWLDGGVTGHESFELSEDALRRAWGRSWVACSGTAGSYDRLVVPQDEMQRFFAWAGIAEPS